MLPVLLAVALTLLMAGTVLSNIQRTEMPIFGSR
jgi:hypothetical protein